MKEGLKQNTAKCPIYLYIFGFARQTFGNNKFQHKLKHRIIRNAKRQLQFVM